MLTSRSKIKYSALFFLVSVLVKLSVSYTLASFVNKKDFHNQQIDILIGRKKLPLHTLRLTNILQNQSRLQSTRQLEALEVIGMLPC